MPEMGSYCKAYLAKQLREFPGWKEDTTDLRPDTQEVDGEEVEMPRSEIGDEDILYVQEDFVVTDGIFKDENVVFSEVTDEWKTFCREKLEFEVPVYEIPEIPVAESADGGESGGDAPPAA